MREPIGMPKSVLGDPRSPSGLLERSFSNNKSRLSARNDAYANFSSAGVETDVLTFHLILPSADKNLEIFDMIMERLVDLC
jgi:hypothetical protein